MAEDQRSGRTCWKCHRQFPLDVRVCVTCGVDLETGADLAHKWDPVPDPDEVDPYRPRTAYEWVCATLPGLFSPYVLLGFIVMAFIFGALEFFCLLLVSYQVVFTAVTVGAVGLLAWAQGIIFLLVGRFTLLHEGLTEIRGAQWHLFGLLTLAPMVAFFVYLKYAAPAEAI